MGTRVMLAAFLLLVLGPATAFLEQQPLESQAQKEQPGPVPEDAWTAFVAEFHKRDDWRLAAATQSPEFRNKIKAKLETRPWHIEETVRNTLTDQDAHYVKVNGSTWVLRSSTERDAAGVERRVGTLSLDAKKGPHYAVDASRLLPLSVSYLAGVNLENPTQKPAPDMEEKRVMPGATLRLLVGHMGLRNFAIPVDKDGDSPVLASFKGCTCLQAIDMICHAAGWKHSYFRIEHGIAVVDFDLVLFGGDQPPPDTPEAAQEQILRRLESVVREYDEKQARTPEIFSAGPK